MLDAIDKVSLVKINDYRMSHEKKKDVIGMSPLQTLAEDIYFNHAMEILNKNVLSMREAMSFSIETPYEGQLYMYPLGTHAFDIIHWLVGPTKNVSGLLSTSIKERFDPKTKRSLKVTSEDIALAELQIYKIEKNLIFPAQVTLSAVARQGRGCCFRKQPRARKLRNTRTSFFKNPIYRKRRFFGASRKKVF